MDGIIVLIYLLVLILIFAVPIIFLIGIIDIIRITFSGLTNIFGIFKRK